MRVNNNRIGTLSTSSKGKSAGKRRLPFLERLRNPVWLLGWIAILLAGASAIVYYSIYHEGDIAGQNAQALLTEYNQAASKLPSPSAAASVAAAVSATATQTSPGEDYTQPAAPEVDPSTLTISLPGYDVIGKLTIETIGVELPVISKTTAKALKVSICHYGGAMPGEAGNMIITGHNYANGAHFGKLNKLKKGDAVAFQTPDGKVYRYVVYDMITVTPDNVDALNKTQGDYCLTLVTCASSGNRRLVVRCTAGNP